ncbi:hypothetical protein F0562_012313 [Nyssa sinensis]|uniref:Uncharacterized protein n=1 Tax=Nyssa sinensis TaxID=561372 RepID=A0A5J4ZXC5_9ASTE|nr:hypothetical protein F0562_012313 [Nyssa sinensis]
MGILMAFPVFNMPFMIEDDTLYPEELTRPTDVIEGLPSPDHLIGLLITCARFWDRVDHAFCFNMEELCPTFEELCSILDVTIHGKMIFSKVQRGYSTLLSNLLSLNIVELRLLVQGESFSLLTIMDCFKNQEPSRARLAALALYMISHFLLLTDTDIVDARLIGVVDDLGKKGNIVCLILVETLNGLDMVHNGLDHEFSGSPLCLMMWLKDKLALLESPQLCPC